jgi:hypothetical protein
MWKFGLFVVFSENMPVILKYWYLFIGAFCHSGKFIFLKSTLNSASFDVWQDWDQKKKFRPLLGALPKVTTFQVNSNSNPKKFSPVFGIFT